MDRLALGTVQFGLPYGVANQSGQVSRAEAKKMLSLAANCGVDTIDTAIAYGESEACLGAVGVQGYRLVTKIPPAPFDAKVNDWVEAQICASLERLRVKKIYGLLLHDAGQLLGENGKTIYQYLQELKKSGRVKKIGVSIYSPSDLDAIAANHLRLDLVQAPFNLIDRRLLTTGWLRRLKREGVEIHTRSAFLQGLLLMPHKSIPKNFAAWENLWSFWHAWLATHDQSALRACLAYPLSFPEIDRVVVGADSASQLAQILCAASSPLSFESPDLHCEDESLINPANWPKA